VVCEGGGGGGGVGGCFGGDQMAIVLIGKASEIQSIAAKLAPTIDRKSISQPGF